jgi:hypothetical protein
MRRRVRDENGKKGKRGREKDMGWSKRREAVAVFVYVCEWV